MIIDIATRMPGAAPASRINLAAFDDRCALRTPLAISAMLRPAGVGPFHTTLRDISVAGFRATSLKNLSVKTLCWLSLPGLESLQAQVVWWDDGQIGGAFAKLLNPIVLDHLVERWQRI